MKKEDSHKVIHTMLGLNSETCTLVPLTDRVIRIYFDDKIREADVQRIKYKIKDYCEVTQYNHYTLDLLKKKSLNSLVTH